MSSLDINQIKDENDLINLSQVDLIRYSNEISSLITIEESTLKGFDQEYIYYKGQEQIVSDQLIDIDFAIFASTAVLNFYINEEGRLINESTIIANQIISTITEINKDDSTIIGTTFEISSLTSEKLLLEREVFNANSIFEQKAMEYSSMYITYETNIAEYEALLNNINTTSSFLESSIQVANESERLWMFSYSTLQGLEYQFSTLTQQEEELLLERSQIEIDIQNAETAILSTNTSFEYYSSIHRAALINRQYVTLLSTEVEAIKLYSGASNMYDKYIQRFQSQTGELFQDQAGGGEEEDIPMTGEELSNAIIEKKNIMNTRWGELTDIRKEISSLKHTVENAGNEAYDTLIRGIDTEMAFQYSSFYYYKELAKKIREVDEPYYISVRDSNLALESTYSEEARVWRGVYVSSFIGYNELIEKEYDLQGVVLSNDYEMYQTKVNTVQRLDYVCGGYIRLKHMEEDIALYDIQKLRKYENERTTWAPGRYMSTLVTDLEEIKEIPIEEITVEKETLDDIFFNKLSSLTTGSLYTESGAINIENYNKFIEGISSILTEGATGALNSSELNRINTISELFAKNDFSTLSKTYGMLTGGGDNRELTRRRQRGGQQDPRIDEDLANEIFDVTYLLYSQNTPSIPRSLTLNNETVIFDSSYRPRSVAAFGPMGGDMSSLAAYSAISTQKMAEYNEAVKELNTYNMEYISVSKSIEELETSLGDSIRNLKILGIESTLLLEEINSLNILAAKERIDLLNAFNEQERATYEFRETYIREQRIQYQNTYEDELRVQLYSISSSKGAELASKGDTSTIIDYMTEIINTGKLTGTLGTSYSNFQNVNEALANFSNLYRSYGDRGNTLSNYSQEADQYYNKYTYYKTLLTQSILPNESTDLFSTLTQTYTEIEEKKQMLDRYQSSVVEFTALIDARKVPANTAYYRYVPNTADAEDTISSFLRAGFQRGL